MMKPQTRISLRQLPRALNLVAPYRPVHSTAIKAANVAPIVGTGPPPEAPVAAVPSAYQRVERKRRQAEMLKEIRDVRSGKKDGKSSPLKKRFWTDVHVKEVDGALQIYLDKRPLRHPTTKEVMSLPLSKTHLASALALEWDLLTSAQEATRQHLIPLTSLICRALDIQADDAEPVGGGQPTIREKITTTVLRYLDTDSLLCWVPPAGPHDLLNDAGESLRDVQKKTAEDICSFLTSNVWPGVKIEPVLDGHGISPRAQDEGVREVIQGWVSGLDAWELAGLERGVLAGKSLIAAARLVAEWSEGSVQAGAISDKTFGADEAATATSLEVSWQATQWGEVEDTHDVNKEDVLRQLASVVLLVSGAGKP